MPGQDWQVFFPHGCLPEREFSPCGLDRTAEAGQDERKGRTIMTKHSVIDPRDLDMEEWSQGVLYGGKDVRLGNLLGLKGLGAAYSEVMPGKSGCPFHNHHVEDELFIILEGEGTYRIGHDRIPVRAGHVLGAPAGGTDTAHQLINTGTVPLRYLSISTKAATEICEYPDSGKFLAKTLDPATGEYRFNQMVSETESIDYWQGEPGA